MFPVLDLLLPAREITRMRRHPSPTVAWHALDDDAFSFPLLLSALVLLFALAIARASRYYRYATPKLTLPKWCKDPLGVRTSRSRHAHHANAADKLARLVPRYRALQTQLQERDQQLARHAHVYDSARAQLAHAQGEARRLRAHAHARAHDAAGLERVVGLLEADKAAFHEAQESRERELEHLRAKVEALEQALSQQSEQARRAEAALGDAVRCNEQLLVRLREREGEWEAALVQQGEAHAAREREWAARLEGAREERGDLKAKLKKARAETRVKADDVARLEAQAEQTHAAYEAQRASFTADLGFVHTESQCARDMYQSQLAAAQAEASTLRTELAAALARYDAQSAQLTAAQASLRAATTKYTHLELKLAAAAAEKKAADALEALLHDALRREQDAHETLAISFDVLERAYAFLASELVRTEHALADSHPLLFRNLEIHAARTPSPADTEPYSDYDGEESRSWPATPGLSRSMRSVATSVASPGVRTPPLPALCLEAVVSSDSASTLKRGEGVFSWEGFEAVPVVS